MRVWVKQIYGVILCEGTIRHAIFIRKPSRTTQGTEMSFGTPWFDRVVIPRLIDIRSPRHG